MILHVAILGWLIWYGPVRNIMLERGKPKREALIRGKELEKVIEQMQRSVAEELEDRVTLLKNGQDRMATNFDTLNAHFQPFEENQKATALMRFEKYAAALKADQESLMQVLVQAKATKNFDIASKAGQEKVPVMISALDEVRRGVLLLSSDETIAQMHALAETALFKVEKPLRDIGSLLGRHRRLEREIQESKAQVKLLGSAMQASRDEHERVKKAYDELAAKRKAVLDQMQALRKVKPRNNDAINEANEVFKKLNEQYKTDRKPLSDANRKARDNKYQFDRVNKRLDECVKAFNGLNIQTKLPEYLQLAIDNLAEASALETQVIEQVLAATKDQADESASEVPAS
tara:strand:- start:3 stop:1043 length:1041 start_codon:yes stop_codon:yes gene_type:complete